MDIKSICKQTNCYQMLLSSLSDGKLFHACMLVGKDKMLSKSIAKMLAAKLLAGETDQSFEAVEHKVMSSIHPDLKEFGEDKPIDAAGAREIVNSSITKAYEGVSKVYIIYDFDEAGASASNILLKTIEEPPAGTYFILLVKNENRVLQTILSRSQRYYVDELSSLKIEEVLTQEGEKDAKLIAAQSAGSLTRAMDIRSSGEAKEVYNFVMDAMKNLNSTTKFGEYAAKLDSLKGSLAEILDFFMSVCDELIKFQTNSKLIKNKGLESEYANLVPYWGVNGLVMVIEEAVKARAKLDKKITAINIIDQFLFKIVEVRIKCKR